MLTLRTQVSGMPLADYFRTNIFRKYSLSSTLYDPTNGILGTHKGQLPYPAYLTYLQPGQTDAITDTAGATLEQLTASAGNPAYWGGDADAAAAVGNAAAASSDPAARRVSIGMTAKYPGPSGFDWTLANAAGAIVSTPQDMGKWLRALLVDPDHLGLGKDVLREFLTLSTVAPGMPSWTVSTEGRTVNATLTFAQGLVVLKDLQHPRGLGVSNVYYLGSLGGFQASIYMWLHPTDASKDVFVNAVAATVLPDRSNWPEAAQNISGFNCSVVNSANSAGDSFPVSAGKSTDLVSSGGHSGAGGSRRLLGAQPVQSSLAGRGPAADVSALLCELTMMAPSAIKTVPDLLARKAYKALMGREWFGMQ
jgi:CubicO group peptidase (beta-lactamase class C family)